MKIGVLTVVYQELPVEQALERLAALGVQAVELGTGCYPGDAHCKADELLANAGAAQRLRHAVASRGMKISALSCHGNALHPNPEVADAVARRVVEHGAAGGGARGACGQHVERG
jgi:sugar phosphate isomerase/epimerase